VVTRRGIPRFARQTKGFPENSKTALYFRDIQTLLESFQIADIGTLPCALKIQNGAHPEENLSLILPKYDIFIK